MKNFLIRLFVLAALAILVFCLSKRFSSNHTKPLPIGIEGTVALFDRMHESEKKYSESMDSMKQVNASLSQRISNNRASLVAIKKENTVLKQSIDKLLFDHYSITDTSEYYTNCDSLAITIQTMQKINLEKDSLYDSLSTDYLSQLSIKDSMITLQEDQCDSLRESLSVMLIQNEQLVNENNTQRDIIKKHKKGKYILGSILVAVTGLFAVHVVH